jgi:hypothetical protein
LIHKEVGEKELAISAVREGVARYATAGCRTTSDADEVCRNLARILAHFGEHEEAIDLLGEMLPAPSWHTVHLLQVDPAWDPLRDHPRFQALLEKHADDVEG